MNGNFIAKRTNRQSCTQQPEPNNDSSSLWCVTEPSLFHTDLSISFTLELIELLLRWFALKMYTDKWDYIMGISAYTTIDTNKKTHSFATSEWILWFYARVNATNISEVRRNKPTIFPIFATIRSRNKQLAYTNTCTHTHAQSSTHPLGLVHVLRSISSNWLTYRETRSHTLPFERIVHTTSQPTSSPLHILILNNRFSRILNL